MPAPGAYLTERTLTPAAVASRGMRVAYWRPVDSAIQGQLLYVPSLNIGSRTVDVVFATTINGSVYAYDANEHALPGTDAGLLWRRQLDAERCKPPPEPCTPHYAQSEPFGVLSTPVIDPENGRLYVVARLEDDVTRARYVLFALDLQNGEVIRHQTLPGKKSDGSSIPFVPAYEGQRSALLLSRGSLYVAFGVWGDEGTQEYHGWLLRYDAQTFTLTGAFNTSPEYKCTKPGGSCCDNPNDRKPVHAGKAPASGRPEVAQPPMSTATCT